MKFLVHLSAEKGRAKSVLVDALDIRQAEEIATKEFPSCKVGRITSDTGSIGYFEGMKEIKKLSKIKKGF